MSHPQPGETYRHYKKGDLYEVVGMALSSEDEWTVVYKALYENPAAGMFVRPVKEWSEDVEWPQGSGTFVKRFSKV